MALIPTLCGLVVEVRQPAGPGYYRWEVVLEGATQTYPTRALAGRQVVRFPAARGGPDHPGCSPGDRVTVWASPLAEPGTWEAEGVKVHKSG